MSQAIEDYQPFGEQWRKELRKMSISSITAIFQVERLAGEKKEDLIDKVRVKHIVKQFNDAHPIGSKLLWKPSTQSEPIEVTVKVAAYPHYGNVVAFFNERSGFCCVEPEFLP